MDHKKFIKIELITWIVLAGLLIVILVLSILNKSKINYYEFRSSLKVENFSYNIDTTQDMKIVQEHSITAKDITKINIDLSSEDINIIESKDQNIYIVEKSNRDLKENELCKIQQDNHELHITKPKLQINSDFFNIRNQMQLDIYLPAGYEGDLLVKVSSGDLTVSSKLDLKENVFEAYHMSGDIEVENEIRAGKVTFNVQSGDIDVLKEVYAQEISMNSKSGDITLDKVVAESYNVKVSSGNISVMSLKGKGEVVAQSGNVDLNIEDITGDVYCETMSGDIDLGINPNMNCNLYAHCVSGDIDSDIPAQYPGKDKNKAIAKIGTPSTYKVDAKAMSGDIHLAYH
jgi:lia operon protein LiaG